MDLGIKMKLLLNHIHLSQKIKSSRKLKYIIVPIQNGIAYFSKKIIFYQNLNV